MAFIDISGCVFENVAFGVGEDVDYIAWAFLTRLPSLDGIASYASGYTTFKEAFESTLVSIPSDASILAVYYKDADAVVCPTYISFFNSEEKTPLQNLQDPTLPEYSYPISEILPSQGTITLREGEGYKYVPDNEWITAFVDITECTFDKVTLEVNAETGLLGYTFLKSRPHMYEIVSFAGDYENWIWVDTAKGDASMITLEIPEDATCMVIYCQDKGPVYYTPSSVTFFKDSTESSDN